MSDTPLLHIVDRGKQRHYCGPTAIAAITGLSFDQVYKKIRRFRNEGKQRRGWTINGVPKLMPRQRKSAIRGMHTGETLEILRRCGFKPKSTGYNYKTLSDLLKDRGHIKTPILIHVTRHYIVAAGGMVLDTHTKGIPIPMMEYHKLRWRVKQYWQF